MTFDGRVCAITGAASGIGRALAIELARRGSDVALCDRNEAGVQETAKLVAATGRKASARGVDVANREAVHTFARDVIAEHGQIDAIVNNAGVSMSQSFEKSTYEDLEWMLNINLWGVIHGCKAFLPHLLERRTGWIVNLSSVFGMIGVPTQSAYNMAKFAVRGLSESLRQEIGDRGVSVCCVHPGGIRTNIVRNGRFFDDPSGSKDHAASISSFDKMARTTPERAATVIADGMAKHSPRILIGADAYMIDAMARTSPTGYPALISMFTKRV